MMRIPSFLIGLWMLSLIASLGGCASRVVRIDNPIAIARTEYDRVFEAAIRVLRDYHFVIARQDRRFGEIVTRPRAAASALEPWFIDNTTAHQTLNNTLNYDRRIVYVYLEKVPRTAPPGAKGSARPKPAEVGGVQTDYQLRVDVQVERRQIPPTNLNTAAVTSVTRYGYQGITRFPIRTEQGYETSTWRPLGHDTYLAQRLVGQILAVAGRIQPLHNTVTPENYNESTVENPPVERVEPGEIPAPPTDEKTK